MALLSNGGFSCVTVWMQIYNGTMTIDGVWNMSGHCRIKIGAYLLR